MLPIDDTNRQFYIGVMSGTSLDGVDLVLAACDTALPEIVATLHRPYPPDLRQQLATLTAPGANEIARLGCADIALGRYIATLIAELLASVPLRPEQIVAIGSHGHTIRHAPDANPPFTLQIGDAATLAELTGITTVADFRRRDIAAGGQGAPLVPLFHEQLLRCDHVERVCLNIGGMANITLLPASHNRPVTGFDTGPGNVLLDSWISYCRNEGYDSNGDWAASGRVITSLLQQLRNDPYFAAPIPKSTGRERFNLAWLQRYLHGDELAVDVQTTVTELTASTIADAILRYGSASGGELFICGGGVHNRELWRRLTNHLPQWKLRSTAAVGLDPDWVEALAFAWLAQRTLRRQPGNLPAVTGAHRAVILGAIHPVPGNPLPLI